MLHSLSLRFVSLSTIAVLIAILSACGGGGGGSSSGGGTPPPSPANPDANGIATFANGVKFDTSRVPNALSFQVCQRLMNSHWKSPAPNPYTLNGYGTQAGQSITFTGYLGTLMGGIIKTEILRMDYGGGTVEDRWLAMATDGSIHLLKLTGAGAADFEITSFTQSPKPFLGVSQGLGSTWAGGFNGNDMMEIVGVNVTSPGGVTGCYQIRQTTGSTVTDWWYIEGEGFYDTRRSVNGYERAATSADSVDSVVPSGLSRTPFGNG